MKWGLTAEALAERAGITRATVAKIESGNGNPTIETIAAISRVFSMSAGDLICQAEATGIEMGKTVPFIDNGLEGHHIWFPGFEIYRLKAGKGVEKESKIQYHENTAEVCLVLSGRLRIFSGGVASEMGAGMSIRFKAIHEHRIEILEDCEFLLLHHPLP